MRIFKISLFSFLIPFAFLSSGLTQFMAYNEPANPHKHVQGAPVLHTIGERFGGGIIFYLYTDAGGEQHGLIAAIADAGPPVQWYSGSCKHVLHYSDNGGKINTETIVSNEGKGMKELYAAKVCHNYSVTIDGETYNDWFLPSKQELDELYQQKDVVGGFVTGPGHRQYYWSSTESIDLNDKCAACIEFFSNGTKACSEPKKHLGHVRPVRAF